MEERRKQDLTAEADGGALRVEKIVIPHAAKNPTG